MVTLRPDRSSVGGRGLSGREGTVQDTDVFEAQRPRLLRIAARVLDDPGEAEDVVQQAWLRLHRNQTDIDSLPAWLTTVTTRLCLDRLKARIPAPVAEVVVAEAAPDPADDMALAETVGLALQVVLDRLTPRERVAFVLHDSFGFEFSTIAAILDTTPVTARKLASRARAKVGQPPAEDQLADWEVVDAFMAAAREGDFDRLLRLLAPEATSRPTTPPSWPAPRRGSRAAARWRPSSTAAPAPRSRYSSAITPVPPGSTAARRWSPSTSPSSTAQYSASRSAPSPRCWHR